MALKDTRFRDIAGRGRKAEGKLRNRLKQLHDIKNKKNGRSLNDHERLEFELLTKILELVDKPADPAQPTMVDPLFVGLRALFNGGNCILPHELISHDEDGVLIFNTNRPKAEAIEIGALVSGLLMADRISAPPIVLVDNGASRATAPDMTGKVWQNFTQAFFEAVGEATGMAELAHLVLQILVSESDLASTRGTIGTVDAEEFAKVMRILVKDDVTTDDNQLGRKVDRALDKAQGHSGDGPLSDQVIDLPDLEDVADNDIVAENVKLMGPMIVSAMFDELKAYQVIDVLVERFQDGSLAISSGKAGELLYQYWREAPNRMSEMERRTFYATTMGMPGGNEGNFVNREFNDLWLRFVSSVSEFVRQNEVDKLLRTTLPSPVSHQQVRKSARDLASNLSLHGYGMAYYAALELQEQIKFMIKLLGDKEIKSAYGARDMWQVIDQVAALELGGAKTSSRYRTLATCGAIITRWLSDNCDQDQRRQWPAAEHRPDPVSGAEAVRAKRPDPSGRLRFGQCLRAVACRYRHCRHAGRRDVAAAGSAR